MSLIENYGPNVVARSPAAGVRMTRPHASATLSADLSNVKTVLYLSYLMK